jgi:hypothetical protein
MQFSEKDTATLGGANVPLMTREAFAAAVGLPIGVLIGQCERGYWPQVTIGKRVLINVEALRMHAIERGREFAL